MKSRPLQVILLLLLAIGCSHGHSLASELTPSATLPQSQEVMVAADSKQTPLQSTEASVKPASEKNIDDYKDVDDPVKGDEEEKAGIDDPLESFNRAMYHFNDKMYFWVLKPVAQGYGKIVPKMARVGVSNFFSNLIFPVRFVNCLLQANFRGAAEELGRFTINTIWGIGGLLDLASHEDINFLKHDEDFGQTLGVYGLGQGFYINWPIWGPSSPRDTAGLAGDFFLHPFTYLNPWYVFVGARAYDQVNDTSLKIGDYESLKEAAIDPYVAIRDAYVQYRLKKVKQKNVHASILEE
jgi:phospholipid-binding lipoprotein MlaA